LKKNTIYFDPAIYQALRTKAGNSQLSMSEIVNEAVGVRLADDQADLSAFPERAEEPEISYEALLKDLKAQCKCLDKK
jgi:hypothetical protein